MTQGLLNVESVGNSAHPYCLARAWIGREGVRNYWTRQWAMVDPHVEPVAFAEGPKAEVIVEVHQVVLKGNLLFDKTVGHIFRVENGLIRQFDIRGGGIDAIPMLRVLRPDHGQRGRNSITSCLPTTRSESVEREAQRQERGSVYAAASKGPFFARP